MMMMMMMISTLSDKIPRLNTLSPCILYYIVHAILLIPCFISVNPFLYKPFFLYIKKKPAKYKKQKNNSITLTTKEEGHTIPIIDSSQKKKKKKSIFTPLIRFSSLSFPTAPERVPACLIPLSNYTTVRLAKIQHQDPPFSFSSLLHFT